MKSAMAVAQRPEQRLILAPTFQPDVDLLIQEGVAVFGVKGSGKSNLVALLIEQLARFFLPMVIFDIEGEYTTLVDMLPHGILATADRIPSGRDILTHGLQVVIDLKSFESEDSAALAMAKLVWQLMDYASTLDPSDRVPCIVHLDEAAYWLPQRAVEYVSKEQRSDLLDAFTTLASRGRKYGLVPFLYTQQISQIHKNAIRQAGIMILMRQSFDTDIKRYGEYVPLNAERKEQIRSFATGKAVVVLPDGSCPLVQFNERATVHTSHTPKAMRAVDRFASSDFTYTLPDEPESASNLIFLTKQGEKLERADIRAKVLQKIEDFCVQGHTPNLRELGIYLHKPSEQLAPIVQELVNTGLLVAHPTNKTTRYTLAERQEVRA